MKIRKPLALCATVSAVLYAIFLGGRFDIFLSADVLVVVLGLTVLSDVTAHSQSSRRQAYKTLLACFRGKARGHIQADTALSAQAYFNRMAEFALGAAAIGAVMGLISLCINLETITKIGPAIASTVLAMVWGVFLSELIFRDAASSCGAAFQPLRQAPLQESP